jgi:type IV pilus assembly protein PilW
MNNHHHSLSGKRLAIFRQGGLSLIELMVAITISLTLLAGVLQIFMSNKHTSRVQENLGRIQENGRFAIDHISRSLRMTAWQGDNPRQWVLGSLSMANGGVQALFGTNNDSSSGNKSVTINGVKSNLGKVLNGTDTIHTIYQGNTDGLVKDCGGLPVPAGVNVQNDFFINTTPVSVVDVGQLVCQTTSGEKYVLIDGVQSFQIQYGVDTDNDQNANSYVTSNKVTDMSNVISVRIILLLISQEDGLAVTNADSAYKLLDVLFTEPGTDRKLRRRISTTINMRNRL